MQRLLPSCAALVALGLAAGRAFPQDTGSPPDGPGVSAPQEGEGSGTGSTAEPQPGVTADDEDTKRPLVILHGEILTWPYDVDRGSDGIVMINGHPIKLLTEPHLDPASSEVASLDPALTERVGVLCDVLARTREWTSEDGIRVEEIYKRAYGLVREKSCVKAVALVDNVLRIHFTDGSEFGVELPKSDDPGDPYLGAPAQPEEVETDPNVDPDVDRIEVALDLGCLLIVTEDGGRAVVPGDEKKEFLAKLDAACKLDDTREALKELKRLLCLGEDDDADAQAILDHFVMPVNETKQE